MSANEIQLFDNPQPRCPVALVLDTSFSMEGAPIRELNQGLQAFAEEVVADDFARFSVEACIVSFGGRAQMTMPFASFAQGIPGDLPALRAGGGTPMGHAIRIALRELDKRKSGYRRAGIPYYQPWMVLMTDGQPTDDCWEQAAAEAQALAGQQKLVFFGVAIGEYADIDILTRVLPRPPKRLAGLKFHEFFSWLSQSMSRVSQSGTNERVNLPPTDGWAAITT